MPMLTTLRIGLPVCPVHSPERTRSAKTLIRSSDLVDLLDDVDAVDDQRAAARHPQRHVQDRAVLGDVDLLAARTSRRGARASPRLLGQLAEQHHRLVGDPVLGEVEVEAGAVGDQPLAALGVGSEELAQVGVADLLRSGAPAPSRRGAPAAARCTLTPAARTAIVFSSSFQDLTKLFLPSSWRRAASASTSIPAASNSASTRSASPPSGGHQVARPCRGRRRRSGSFSGIVLTVNGEASASM